MCLLHFNHIFQLMSRLFFINERNTLKKLCACDIAYCHVVYIWIFICFSRFTMPMRNCDNRLFNIDVARDDAASKLAGQPAITLAITSSAPMKPLESRFLQLQNQNDLSACLQSGFINRQRIAVCEWHVSLKRAVFAIFGHFFKMFFVNANVR